MLLPVATVTANSVRGWFLVGGCPRWWVCGKPGEADGMKGGRKAVVDGVKAEG